MQAVQAVQRWVESREDGRVLSGGGGGGRARAGESQGETESESRGQTASESPGPEVPGGVAATGSKRVRREGGCCGAVRCSAVRWVQSAGGGGGAATDKRAADGQVITMAAAGAVRSVSQSVSQSGSGRGRRAQL